MATEKCTLGGELPRRERSDRDSECPISVDRFRSLGARTCCFARAERLGAEWTAIQRMHLIKDS